MPYRHKTMCHLLSLAIIVVATRAATLHNPVIGFDEQFYLLVGDRLWRGDLPYVDIFDRKPIGLFLIYAAAAGTGSPFVCYKLLAMVSVTGTAFILYQKARWRSTPFAALSIAILYILWLNFLEGEGGQAPIFYALPMVAAAAIISRGVRRSIPPRWPGIAAMLLVGVALQIKYSVLVEGGFFGCFLIAMAWRAGDRGSRLMVSLTSWIAAALLPTLAACGFYVARGHVANFVFANFVSVFSQGRASGVAQLAGAGVIAAILAPLLIFLIAGWRGRAPSSDAISTPFLLGWLATAFFGIVAYWRFASPHYAIPVMLPLLLLLAPVIEANSLRRGIALALIVVAFVAGQAVLVISTREKGGAEAALAVARAAHAKSGCIYVYDGYPALYLLTGSCLPTRWVFPGHLSTRDEASPTALGIDPVAEVRRILATRPVAIIDDFPRFVGGNPATHAVLQHTLDTDYALAACVPTGSVRVRLVYRQRIERPVRPSTCPSEAALRIGYP